MKKITLFLLLLFPIVNSCEISGDPELLELILEIKNQNEELKNELNSLHIKTDSILNSLKNSEENNQAISNKLNEVTSDLNSVLSELEELNSALQNNNADMQVLKAQMEALNEKYNNLLIQLEKLELLQQLLVEMELLKAQITELEEKTDKLLSLNDETNSSLEQLKRNIEQVRSDLDKVLSEISKLTISLSDANADIGQILEELSILQGQCKELTILLESLFNAPKIGAEYGGGIVFYLDESSLHGFIVSKENQRNSAAEWGCYCEDIKNTKPDIGSGLNNTREIVRQCTSTKDILNSAAKIVDVLVLDGYDDWYLPSKDELNLMYENLHLNGIGNFSKTIPYWSSTQTIYGSCGISGGAWTQDFGSGEQIQEYKSGYQNTGAVRAIRNF